MVSSNDPVCSNIGKRLVEVGPMFLHVDGSFVVCVSCRVSSDDRACNI